MVNGKNVSMFASYPHSAAWELAHTFAALLFRSPFFNPGPDREAAQAQAKAMVKVMRLVSEIEESQSQRDPVAIDWIEEASRVEAYAQQEEWGELIDWAQELRGRDYRH